MKRIEVVARLACFLASVMLLVPAPLWAEGSVVGQGQDSLVGDLALHENSTLIGQVVASDGTPRCDQAVTIGHQGQTIATARTDAKGYFAVRGLRGGIYTVQTGDLAGTYRAWTADAAPPSAKPGILMVEHQVVVRGQGDCVDCPSTEGPSSRLWGGCHGPVVGFLTHPIVIGAIIATAIAVPIAANDDDSGS